MNTIVRTFVTFLSLFLIVSLVFAAIGFDDRGNPNDPRINERANACFEGGTMEGRCQTEIDWIAGWYLIRYNEGLIAREDFPSQYRWILPPLPKVVSSDGSNDPGVPTDPTVTFTPISSYTPTYTPTGTIFPTAIPTLTSTATPTSTPTPTIPPTPTNTSIMPAPEGCYKYTNPHGPTSFYWPGGTGPQTITAYYDAESSCASTAPDISFLVMVYVARDIEEATTICNMVDPTAETMFEMPSDPAPPEGSFYYCGGYW
ncbi:hypothetical protein G4Y79_24405 [Phototrophicus methaneseepsis]|uniref:Uncharacterized protein n=1 Tax=Phototrophicus methaneseepsis TaxID=2710758 RepID=A0A7S8E9B5_9CHLR|nr:hypothetical protein [Phototrophicus methaneseepsis]QPC82788.1 hypothetical protein G4Y79_24405 [Phototrophicus methaneseepsis]